MKRKSTISNTSAAMKYEEAIGENLSHHGMQSSSAFEVNMNYDTRDPEVGEHNGTVVDDQKRERPKSLPLDSTEVGVTPVPAPRNYPKTETSAPRPIPKPRPKTMILKSDHTGKIMKSKTMSAENLLQTIPAVQRIRTGSELGRTMPPVPLKRAQMYRSQEGVSSNTSNSSKESKF